jgi:hypothetical protein
MKRNLLLLFTIFSLLTSKAQEDLELAMHYYNGKQFEQAKLYFDKLANDGVNVSPFFQEYKITLLSLNEFKTAESLCKKRIKALKDAESYFHLGTVYIAWKKESEKTDAFNTAIEKTSPYRIPILETAQLFTDIFEYEWALKTYEKGKLQSKDQYTFSYEIANTQGALGNFSGMLSAYLDILSEDQSMLGEIESSLMQNIDFIEDEAKCNELKTLLLKRIQVEPNQSIYSELLSWFLIQRNDFNGAYTQLFALDKRNNENGQRLMNLGALAQSNQKFDVASKCYNAVISKGNQNPFYGQACIKKLQSTSSYLRSKPNASKEEYLQIDAEYTAIQNQINQPQDIALLKKDWGHLKAFHLEDAHAGEVLLREALAIGGLSRNSNAEIKLELADILLFQDNIWEASLFYSQVELDFKEDVLGHEAKFKNAKISFYTGDFEWAQGQLDVLKASTSKLISNDAMQLSLLITDNFNMDTIPLPMLQFARADLLAFQNRYTTCFETLDSITTLFPNHSLTDEIIFLKAKIYRKQGLINEALSNFETILNIHFNSVYADDALFAMAEINDFELNNKEIAHTLYERILTEFPGSLFVVEARKRFRAYTP